MGSGPSLFAERCARHGPSPDDLIEWFAVECVERVAAASFDHDQARRLEHGEVLGDGLTGHANPVLGGEARANL